MVELERADVSWNLSIELNDLPPGHLERGLHAHRALTIGDDRFDFSVDSTTCTRVYHDILAGSGYRIEEAHDSIELVHHRTAPIGHRKPPLRSSVACGVLVDFIRSRNVSR